MSRMTMTCGDALSYGRYFRTFSRPLWTEDMQAMADLPWGHSFEPKSHCGEQCRQPQREYSRTQTRKTQTAAPSETPDGAAVLFHPSLHVPHGMMRRHHHRVMRRRSRHAMGRRGFSMARAVVASRDRLRLRLEVDAVLLCRQRVGIVRHTTAISAPEPNF